MSFPSNIMAGIVTRWNATSGLNAMKLRFGRQDERDLSKPYAVFFQVSDLPTDAFSANKTFDKIIYQISVWDKNSDTVASYVSQIIAAYHRNPLTLSTGRNCYTLRKSQGMMIEPKLDANSDTVYQGYATFEFCVDN